MKHNTLSPDWGEAFVWDLSGCKPTELALELYDWCAGAGLLTLMLSIDFCSFLGPYINSCGAGPRALRLVRGRGRGAWGGGGVGLPAPRGG